MGLDRLLCEHGTSVAPVNGRRPTAATTCVRKGFRHLNGVWSTTTAKESLLADDDERPLLTAGGDFASWHCLLDSLC